VPQNGLQRLSVRHLHRHRSLAPQKMSPSPLDEMNDEHKANLFQALLRDLQIEGVPLLGCGELLGKRRKFPSSIFTVCHLSVIFPFV
jgi:hypothetical protein